MVVASQLTAVVSASGVESTKAQMQDVGNTVTQTGGIFRNALGGALSFTAGLAGQALGFLKDQVTDSVKIAMQHADAMAQTAQAIKSTGDASGMSAQQIADLAEHLSQVTPFAENATQAGENILLTFTGIGKDVFPQVTSTMLDMSQAMGMDTKQAALQLGKALNDPLTGMTALSREGVTFSDAEKQAIKTMMQHNDVAGAQKIMLKELQTEFGGSAEAAGKTFGGQLEILKNKLNDVKEHIGTALLPILSKLTDIVSNDVMPIFDKFGNWFSDELPKLGAYFKPLEEPLHTLDLNVRGMLVPAFERLGGVFHQLFAGNTISGAGLLRDAISGIGNVIGGVTDGIDNFYEGVVGIQRSNIVTQLRDMASTLSAEFGPALQNIGKLLGGELGRELHDLGQMAQQVGSWFMSSVVPALKDAAPGFERLGKTILTDVVPAAIKIRGDLFEVVEHALKKFGPILGEIIPPLIRFAGILAKDISDGLKFIMPYVQQAAKELQKFADEIIDRVEPIVKGWIDGLKPLIHGFSEWWHDHWSTISAVLKGIWDEIQGIVKIAWELVSGIVKIGLDILGGNWKQAWADFKTMLSGVWEGIKEYLKGAWETIKAIFAPVGQWFKDKWQEVVTGFHSTLDGLGQIASNIWAGVTGAVKSGFNSVIDLVNGVIDHINSINVGNVGIHINEIPHLASGTNFFGGGLALLGEEGPELAYMPRGARVIPATQTAQMLSGGGYTGGGGQPIILQVDGHTFARLFMPYMVGQIRNQVGVRF